MTSTNTKKFFASRPAVAFTVGIILAMGGSVLASSIGTDLSVSGTAAVTGVSTLTGSVAFNGGLTASGSTANDFSGSTGTFKTSTGAVTIGTGVVTIGTGAVTISGATTHTSTVAIGSSGTVLTQALAGTCTQLMPNQGIVAASSTVYMDCAVSNVVSGDKVFVQLPMSATSTVNATSSYGGWKLLGAAASTTSGYISFAWQNQIGQATNIPSCGSSGGGTACGTSVITGSVSATGASIGLGSSTQYWIIR